MPKTKKIDTVFMEYLPSSPMPADQGWSLAPPVDRVAVMQRLIKYLLGSILFLGITIAVFYGLFSWLTNQ